MRPALLLFLAVSVACSQVTLIHAGRVLDVKAGRHLERYSILIEGDRIQSVHPTAGETVPPNARILDFTNATVLPGLIDTHTHLLHENDLRLGSEDTSLIGEIAKRGTTARALFGVAKAREMLEAGFTSVRDLGNSGVNGDVALRDAIEAGWFPGPRMMVSTRAISLVGGQIGRLPIEGQSLINQEYVQISGVDEARKAVRQAFYDGADCIKIIADNGGQIMSDEELKAIVDEVRRGEKLGFGKRPVAAHAVPDAAVRAAIAAGVDSIEHGYGISQASLQLMADKKIYFVMTESNDDPEFYAYLNQISSFWNSGRLLRGEQLEHYKAANKQRIRSAFELGVPVAFGSDSYTRQPGKTRGAAALGKLFAYSEAGVPNAKVLQSATSNAANLLGWNYRLGALEKGLLADLIAVEGDPLTDIQSLKNIRLVMKGGQQYK